MSISPDNLEPGNNYFKNKLAGGILLTMLLATLAACGGRASQPENAAGTNSQDFSNTLSLRDAVAANAANTLLPTPTLAYGNGTGGGDILHPPTPEITPTPDPIRDILDRIEESSLENNGRFHFSHSFRAGLHDAYNPASPESLNIYAFGGGAEVLTTNPETGNIHAKGVHGLRALNVLTQPDVLEQVIGRSTEDPRLATLYATLTSGGDAQLFSSRALDQAQKKQLGSFGYSLDTQEIPIDSETLPKRVFLTTVFDENGDPVFWLKYVEIQYSNDFGLHQVLDIQIFAPQSDAELEEELHQAFLAGEPIMRVNPSNL